MLNVTKLFEIIDIQWFTIEDMKKQRDEFRNFYREIVDMIVEKEPEIRGFLEKKMPAAHKKQRGTRKKSSDQGLFGFL
jgi:hypothetical protein